MPINLLWVLPLAKVFDWRIYIFDISHRPLQFKIVQKLHNIGLITRITEHNALPIHNTNSIAIDLANKCINEGNSSGTILWARILCESQETDLVFKRMLAEYFRLLISINQYVVNNIKSNAPTLIISKKYSNIIKNNPSIIHSSIKVKYFFNWEKVRVQLLWLSITIGYMLNLFIQFFFKNNSSKKKYKFAIAVSFPWATKFKGSREFTFLVDDKTIKKDNVVFLIEYPEKKEFYERYSFHGYSLEKAQRARGIFDLFKPSMLILKRDFPILIKLFFCLKRENYIYEALNNLISSRISWAIITTRCSFKNYIYFNKEDPSQISSNIFLKKLEIKTHAYSQFIGGCYQICGRKSIFDNRNVLWSFLNPDYFYLNNRAMIDSMSLHYQSGVKYKNIGNIFSEKIIENRKKINLIMKLKKRYGLSDKNKLIAIFDTTYLDSTRLYSNYDEACYFLKDIINMAQKRNDCIFLFKPSKNDEHFLTKKRYWAGDKGAYIVNLRHEFAKLPNTIMLDDFDDVIDLISISDIVITNSFSSPTADALLAGVPAFWYQAKTDVSFSRYNKIPELVINGYAELDTTLDKILKFGYPLSFMNNPDFDYLIGEKSYKALTGLRLSILG